MFPSYHGTPWHTDSLIVAWIFYFLRRFADSDVEVLIDDKQRQGCKTIHNSDWAILRKYPGRRKL